MKRYLVVIEKTKTGYSCYSPDIPGCVSAGNTRREVEENMLEAIELHLEGLREEGFLTPEPRTDSAFLDVAV